MVEVLLLVLVEMICSDCASVVLCICSMLSTACALTLALRCEMVVRSVCPSAQKAPSAQSVEPGVLFGGGVGAIERGSQVVCKRGMLMCMANGGRYCKRFWRIMLNCNQLGGRGNSPDWTQRLGTDQYCWLGIVRLR